MGNHPRAAIVSSAAAIVAIVVLISAAKSPSKDRCSSRYPSWQHASEAHNPNQWDPPAVKDFPPVAAALDVRAQGCVIEAGRRLFEARFTGFEGAERPNATGDSKPTYRPRPQESRMLRTSGPDANSCAGCHNQPAIGGSGDFVANVFVGAQFRDPPATAITTNVTSERNTIGLFGSGAIEMLAREMTAELQRHRSEAAALAMKTRRDVTVDITAKGIPFGKITVRPDGSYDASRIEGVDADLVIKPFAAKGVVISLREFSINALNHHHGMQSVERFGWERTGSRDFDGDGVEVEFTIGQVTAMTLFQATLPAPEVSVPRDRHDMKRFRIGQRAFGRVGCANCHIPDLTLESHWFTEPDPFNRPGNLSPEDLPSVRLALPVRAKSGLFRARDGTIHIRAFTDLKRHRICDAYDAFLCNERLRQDNVPTDQFITAKLWDAGTSAPYCHRGDCTTISEAILHHSAEARPARTAFLSLPDDEKRALIDFVLAHSAPRD